jgi:hypothetical protein
MCTSASLTCRYDAQSASATGVVGLVKGSRPRFTCASRANGSEQDDRVEVLAVQ